MTPSRRTARESVLKAIYALEQSHDSLEHVIETILKPDLKADAKILTFAESLFLRTVRDAKPLDEIIKGLAVNWDINRIALIDKIAIRIALTEMMTFSDIPVKVTINEAIELGKKYSTEKSGRFINGVLDAAASKLKDEGKIKKSGAGLIETSIQK